MAVQNYREAKVYEHLRINASIADLGQFIVGTDLKCSLDLSIGDKVLAGCGAVVYRKAESLFHVYGYDDKVSELTINGTPRVIPNDLMAFFLNAFPEIQMEFVK